jgi:hypothetical protein
VQKRTVSRPPKEPACGTLLQFFLVVLEGFGLRAGLVVVGAGTNSFTGRSAMLDI